MQGVRRLIGQFVEWALGYEHEVLFEGPSLRVGYPGDAGYDLYVSEETRIAPGEIRSVPTGVKIAPMGPIWFEIKGRSSSMHKRRLEVLDAVIDNGFRGELFAIVHNVGEHEAVIGVGERVCQVVPHRLIPVRFVAGRLPPSVRGTSGFGSSGT